VWFPQGEGPVVHPPHLRLATLRDGRARAMAGVNLHVGWLLNSRRVSVPLVPREGKARCNDIHCWWFIDTFGLDYGCSTLAFFLVDLGLSNHRKY
jgi:hypothetical protein